ncbi:hypothetical protein ACUN3E_33745 [Streptomyces sp. Ju416(a)]|uniref:hypothetical protein n=1 Tax=Streptomyces sp. Ju416(a) TaxID=3446591 RepID=UPI00403E22DD
MDIKMLIAWTQGRYAALKAGKEAGVASTELAVITGSLLLGAGLVVLAIRTKLMEKIGIINSG